MKGGRGLRFRETDLFAPVQDTGPRVVSAAAFAELEAGEKAGPEELFAAQCRARKLPAFEQQYRFAESVQFVGKDGRVRNRGWRFDFAFPEFRLAVEIEGLIPMQIWRAKLIGSAPVEREGLVINVHAVERTFVVMGGHASITGMKQDMEKYNTATLLGWQLLRFEQKAIKPGHAIDMVIRVLAARGWKGSA